PHLPEKGGGRASAPPRRAAADPGHRSGEAQAMTEPSEIRYLFIRRPILAGVIAMVIVLLGSFSLRILPINRYPPITPPSVQVSATYPGATAEDLAAAVASPIEQQLSGLDGLLYFKSSNASDGTMNLQVYFDI